MPQGSGKPCKTCNGTGQITIAGTTRVCPPCLGTGEQPSNADYELQKHISRAPPRICSVCRKSYPGKPHYIAGLEVCYNSDCIETVQNIYG